jgi:uncharacterized protein YecT (DUF1311 family)
MRSGLFLLLLSMVYACVGAAQCKDAMSTRDMEDCAASEYKKADGELNRIYQETLRKLQPKDAQLLRKAQRSWLAYRDAHCDAQYQLYSGGSIAPVILAQCRWTLTAQRAKEIKESYSQEGP